MDVDAPEHGDRQRYRRSQTTRPRIVELAIRAIRLSVAEDAGAEAAYVALRSALQDGHANRWHRAGALIVGLWDQPDGLPRLKIQPAFSPRNPDTETRTTLASF